MATKYRPRAQRVLRLPPDRLWQLRYDRGAQPVTVAECLPSEEAMRLANSANSLDSTPTVYAVEVQAVPVEGGRVIRPVNLPRAKGGAA